MPGSKHLRGVGAKEQRQYEHIVESARKEGRYGKRTKEVAARTVLKSTARKGTAKATERLDPLRATALLFITAGILLIVSFFYATSVEVADQSRLDQSWRQHVVVPATNPPKVDPALKHPVGGVDFAIQVPKLGYFAAVKEGVSTGVLYSGPGHYPETPWPGDMGTVGVAAHNVYWVNFPELKTGDEVDLQTRYGLYRYRVTGSRIVDPSDRTVLVPQSGGYHLTLTTCWPLWAGAFATQRYVIFTEQFYPAPPPTSTS